jgi:ArsR family transcriptional regulator, arsenate/arsenite/antimonite-responsive transcriptional repressor
MNSRSEPSVILSRPTPDPDVGQRSDDTELAALAKALGHPARVRILRFLAGRSSCVCGEVVDELPLAQSTVSEHLRVLKQAGLVRGDIDPPRVCYCVEPSALARLISLVESLSSLSPGDVASDEEGSKRRES